VVKQTTKIAVTGCPKPKPKKKAKKADRRGARKASSSGHGGRI
jgi:hypothetical protein